MATHGIPLWPWLNQAADALPAPERLLLDAARLWQQQAEAGRAPAPALRMLLASADADAVAAPLDALLRLAPRPALAFGCCLCPGIGASEARYLLAIGLAQRGADQESLALWLHALPLLSACLALTHGKRISVALRDAGLVLCDPWRAGGTRQA